MKVLQINSVCGIGSTGRIATDIHNILIEQGHESYIAYGRDLPKNCDNTIKIGNKFDIYKHVALTRIFDKHGFGSKKATQRFINKVKELDPDVIHLHNIHGYYINIEILFDYLKKADKPVVWTLHDCWAFTGHCSHFDYIGCEKWCSECYSCPEKKTYPASLVFDNSKDNYMQKKEIFSGLRNVTIVTPSKWLAGLVEKSFLNKYSVEVIKNGIDLSVFRPTTNNFRRKFKLENKFIILGVASIWDSRKGLKYFHELSYRLQDDEIIVLVGLSKKQMKDLPDRIIGIMRTNNVNKLVNIYSSADVFVNPTLEEVMGMTNVEALACGTPVITFNSGGSPECIDENTGVIIEKGNINLLAEGVKRIKLNLMNTNLCITRAEIFDKDDKFYEYVKLYKLNYNEKVISE